MMSMLVVHSVEVQVPAMENKLVLVLLWNLQVLHLVVEVVVVLS